VRLPLLLLIGTGLVSGCAQPAVVKPAKTQPEAANQAATTPLENGEPSHITVQHILIGFSGSVPGKPIRRKKDEAEKLAAEVLEKAKSGEDFDQLVKTHTNDSPPGIYKMANHGFDGDMTSRDRSNWVYERGGMVPAFGNVGFKLEIGEIGMSDFDEDASPFGWHIIKRLK
jgi:hypothetical protein